MTAESWFAHGRRIAWHRMTGLAVFVAVPAFAAAGTPGVRDMLATVQVVLPPLLTRLLGPGPGWRAALVAFGAGPPLPGTLAAAVLALVAPLVAWRRAPGQAQPGARASPIARTAVS